MPAARRAMAATRIPPSGHPARTSRSRSARRRPGGNARRQMRRPDRWSVEAPVGPSKNLFSRVRRMPAVLPVTLAKPAPAAIGQRRLAKVRRRRRSRTGASRSRRIARPEPVFHWIAKRVEQAAYPKGRTQADGQDGPRGRRTAPPPAPAARARFARRHLPARAGARRPRRSIRPRAAPIRRGRRRPRHSDGRQPAPTWGGAGLRVMNGPAHPLARPPRGKGSGSRNCWRAPVSPPAGRLSG